MNSLTKQGCYRVVCAARSLLCLLGLVVFALSAYPASAQPPSLPISGHSPSEKVGQYQVPDLPGWSRAIKLRPARVITRTRYGKTRRYRVPARTKAIYTRTVDGAALTLFLEATDFKRPVSAKRDILPGLQAGQKIMAIMSGPVQKTTGTKPVPTQIKPETFRGLPAYGMTDTWTNPQGSVSASRTRWFAGKTFGCEQEQTIKGAAISARARAVSNDGWKKLSSGLHDTP